MEGGREGEKEEEKWGRTICRGGKEKVAKRCDKYDRCL